MKIVVKVGTSTLTYGTGCLNVRRTEELCKVLSDLKNSGNEIILVTSGAIGMGVGKLGLKSRPTDIPTKQAAAAVGQCELMYVYDKLFQEYHHNVAQILLTLDDFVHEDRHANFTNTINRLLELGSLPVVNENDTVATDEIKVGDNDTLSALVAKSVKADMLVLLSDIDGLYTSDPHLDKNATLISEVKDINKSIEDIAGNSGSQLGTGGMKTKISAAKICTEAGVDMIITNGQRPNDLYAILEGEKIGTKFIAVK